MQVYSAITIPWIICAEAASGRGKRAFELYKKTAPAYVEERSELHRMEPYVYSQMIAGKDAYNFGEAKNSWLTGTAAWCYVSISQWILGVKPDYSGLMIDPCIPEEWDGYSIKRRFRGTVYNVTILNPHHVSKGYTKFTADGREIEGNIVPDFRDKKEHDIVVILGE